MRVCVVRHGYFPHDPRVQKEVRALLAEGIEVDVLCLRKDRGQPLAEQFGKCRIYRFPFSHVRKGVLRYLLVYSLSLLAFPVLLTMLYLRNRYDYIQVNTMPDMLVFATVVAKLLGARVVLDVHEPMPELWETKFGDRHRAIKLLIAWFQKASVRYADACLTVTDALQENLARKIGDSSKIVVVRNVCDDLFEEYRNDAPLHDAGPFRIVMHGLIEKRYGHELVVDALPRVREAIPEIRFDIIGEGPNIGAVMERARKLACGDIVTYHGFLPFDAMIATLTAAHIGIVALEKSPYSVLVDTNKMYEYIALGLPVIASRLPATVDAFSGKSVRYFEPGDAEGIGRAIVELHADPQARLAMCRSARSEFDAVSWKRQKNTYLSVFRERVKNG